MAYAAPSRCTTHGCAQMAAYRGKCDAHYVPWRKRSQNSAALTPSQRAAFRRAVLEREPECRRCGAPATEADHITPVSEGGALTDLANGQALCASCHAEKSEAERRRGIARAQQAAAFKRSQQAARRGY